MMTPRRHVLLIALAATLFAPAIPVSAGPGDAQQVTPAPKPIIPLKVTVVLTRWQSEKKISSLPFEIRVNANDTAYNQGVQGTSLRMGVDVPIGTVTTQSGNASAARTDTRTEFRNVGTNIDCFATSDDGILFRLNLSIEDSSFYTGDGDLRPISKTDGAAIRTFRNSNRLTIRDGQTMPFTSATDKITGETLKVDVTVNVIK